MPQAAQPVGSATGHTSAGAAVQARESDVEVWGKWAEDYPDGIVPGLTSTGAAVQAREMDTDAWGQVIEDRAPQPQHDAWCAPSWNSTFPAPPPHRGPQAMATWTAHTQTLGYDARATWGAITGQEVPHVPSPPPTAPALHLELRSLFLQD